MNVNDLLNKALNPNNGKYYITEDVLKDIKENYISKDKIKDKIEFYKRYGKIKNSNEYVMSVEIEVLQELLEERN